MLLVFSLDDSKWQPIYLSSLYVIIFWEDGKWQFLYLNNLRIYNIIISALMSISPEILAEKFVMNHYLQKSVIHHQQFDTLCLSLTLSCELNVLGQ